MERRVTRKRQDKARPGGRAMESPVTQEYSSTRSTPNCTLGLPSCRVCIRITADSSPKLIQQLAFWDTYLVSPEVHNGPSNLSEEGIRPETVEQAH